MANKQNLLLLFERKLEPVGFAFPKSVFVILNSSFIQKVFMEKGPNDAVFEVPNNLLSDRYKGTQINTRFGTPGGEKIPVRVNITMPNLKVPMSLGRQENFSLFIPRHRDIATHLINIFMGMQ